MSKMVTMHVPEELAKRVVTSMSMHKRYLGKKIVKSINKASPKGTTQADRQRLWDLDTFIRIMEDAMIEGGDEYGNG